MLSLQATIHVKLLHELLVLLHASHGTRMRLALPGARSRNLRNCAPRVPVRSPVFEDAPAYGVRKIRKGRGGKPSAPKLQRSRFPDDLAPHENVPIPGHLARTQPSGLTSWPCHAARIVGIFSSNF